MVFFFSLFVLSERSCAPFSHGKIADLRRCSGLRFSCLSFCSCCGSGCVQFNLSVSFLDLLIVLLILPLFPASCFLFPILPC